MGPNIKKCTVQFVEITADVDTKTVDTSLSSD